MSNKNEFYKTREENEMNSRPQIQDAGIFVLLSSEVVFIVLAVLNIFSNDMFKNLLRSSLLLTFILLVFTGLLGALAFRQLLKTVKGSSRYYLNLASIFLCIAVIVAILIFVFKPEGSSVPPPPPPPPSAEEKRADIARKEIKEQIKTAEIEMHGLVLLWGSFDTLDQHNKIITLESLKKQLENVLDMIENYCYVRYENKEIDSVEYENCIEKAVIEFCELMRRYRNGIQLENVCE